MNLKPPEGSKIALFAEGADQTIIIPHESGGAMRYFTGLFILFWLGAWFVGFSVAVPQVLSGNAPLFLVFWLGAWTVGGIFAVHYLYRIFRPSVPESLKLTRNGVIYDSGVPPLQMITRYANSKDTWQNLLPKRTRVEIDRRQLQSFVSEILIRAIGSPSMRVPCASTSQNQPARLNASGSIKSWRANIRCHRHQRPGLSISSVATPLRPGSD